MRKGLGRTMRMRKRRVDGKVMNTVWIATRIGVVEGAGAKSQTETMSLILTMAVVEEARAKSKISPMTAAEGARRKTTPQIKRGETARTQIAQACRAR